MDLKNENSLDKWRLPEWCRSDRIWSRLESDDILRNYMIYHDCGKPFCLRIGEDNKKHFDDHSNVSAEIWKMVGGSEVECLLMALDMWAHTCPANEIDTFVSHPLAPTLLIAALCEIHANADMFGGTESTSFKIKWKKIDRLGKRLIKYLES